MTKKEHIAYHNDKIERLHEECDNLQARIHKTTSEHYPITVEDLLYYTNKLSVIDRDLQISIAIRATLLNLES